MTWDETIRYIRSKPEFKELVEKAYFDEDLQLNVERFKSDEEFAETLALIMFYAPDAKKILDVGSGNGISAVAFALNGYDVTSSEPDPSETIGAGAIRKLKEHYKLSNLKVVEEFAEKIDLKNELFDIVYVRQAMHHAYDLKSFIKNLAHFIKPNGFLFTIRDHVIYDQQDKQLFLEHHPLHKYYGGENAFTVDEYKGAMETAGLKIVKVMKLYDSVINYFPISSRELQQQVTLKEKIIEDHLIGRIGFFGKIPFIKNIYKKRIGLNRTQLLNEAQVPGRMYSFIAQKI